MLHLVTYAHAPLLACDGRHSGEQACAIDARREQAPRPFPTVVVQSPFARRAAAGTLPAKVLA